MFTKVFFVFAKLVELPRKIKKRFEVIGLKWRENEVGHTTTQKNCEEQNIEENQNINYYA